MHKVKDTEKISGHVIDSTHIQMKFVRPMNVPFWIDIWIH